MDTVTHIENVIQNTGKETILLPVDTQFEEFDGNPLKFAIVILSGERVPVVIASSDIADCIGHDRKGIRTMIHEDLLLREWSIRVVTASTDGKNREVLALTIDGFIGLMVKINPKRVKNEARREKILAFQRWAIPTLRKIMFQEKYHLDSDRLPLTAQEMNVIFEMIKHYEKTKSVNTYQLLKKTLQKVILISFSVIMRLWIK